MKFRFLFLFSLSLLIAGCSDDEPIVGDNILNFDGPNNAAPSLPAGIYEAAAHFTSSDVIDFDGLNLSAVEFYLYDIPSSVQLLIYDSDGSNIPGDLIYNRDITSEVRSNRWNTIDIIDPVEIFSNGIWISIYLDHAEEMQSIGCDAGPRNINGDWLFDGNFNNWMTFFGITNESINWNIRGITE